jgi:DNA repair exonuclease SbcCD ATPase subunit
MINTLEIENFQSHPHSILEFTPGVNVIRGTSHSGKSVIIRALRWALFNEPRGLNYKPFKKSSSTETSVGIDFSEGNYIIRKRSGTENIYEVNGEKIEAMRSELPEEVSSITQMGPINLQIQEDNLFLFNESSGAVARRLNENVGLSIIDEKLSRANEIVNETRRSVAALNEEIATTELKLSGYAGLEKCEEGLIEIENLEKQIVSLKERSGRLVLFLSDIRTQIQIAEKKKELLKHKHRLREIREVMESWEKDVLRQQALQFLMHQIEIETDRLSKMKSKYLRLKRHFDVHISPSLPEYRELLFDYKNKKQKLFDFQRDIERNAKMKENLEIRLKTLRASLDKLREENKLEFCPTCGAEKVHWRKK